MFSLFFTFFCLFLRLHRWHCPNLFLLHFGDLNQGTGRITTAPTTMAEMTDHSESVLTESRLGRLSVEELARTVVISNIPRQITQDEIQIHFQKGKNGGGEVDDIWMTKNGQAVIVFAGPGGMTSFNVYTPELLQVSKT